MKAIVILVLMFFALGAQAGGKEETKKAPDKENMRCDC